MDSSEPLATSGPGRQAVLRRRRSRAPRATRALARSWPSQVAGLTALGLLLALAFDSGGYFPDSHLGAGAIAFTVLAVLLVVRPPHYRVSTHALLALAALAGLALWLGISSSWSLAPDTALEDMNRTLAYAGLFGLGLIAAGSGRLSRHLVWGLLAVMVAVGGAALLSRLYPDLIETTAGRFGGYRLDYPFGYWNALGAFSSMGAVLALGLAGDPRSRPFLRALAAGAAVLLATTMYFSLSRGAWLALMAGLAMLAVLSAHRGSLLLSGAVAGAGTLAAVARLQAYPGLIDDPAAGAGQLSEGHAFAPLLLLIVVMVVGVQWLLAAWRASDIYMAPVRRYGPAALSVLGGLAVLVGLVAYVARGSDAESWTAARLDDGKDFVDRQWDDFWRTSTVVAEGTARLKTSKGTRSELYRVAFDSFKDRPLAGTGSGSYEYRWAREREVPETVRDAHSLYLETLAELGLIGAAMLGLFLGAIAVAAARSRLRPGVMGRSQAAAVSAACFVWLFHVGLDWDWQMPALTATALLLAATLFPYGRVLKQPGEAPEVTRR